MHAPLPVITALYQRRLRAIATGAYAATCAATARRTPVDSGVLRASWTPSLDGAAVNVERAADARPLAPVLARFALGDVLSYRNAQPYGPRIEYEGHSAQAPAGMVGPSVAEWGANAREAARAAR